MSVESRADLHDQGYTNNSGFTSWTVDFAWAVAKAKAYSQAGLSYVILELNAAPDGSIFYNKAAGGAESQVLVPGTVEATIHAKS
jgi:hypothetical protein